MKNLIILSLLLVIYSCKKQQSNPSTINSKTTQTLSYVSNYEMGLMGNWKLSKLELYSNRTLVSSSTYTNSTDCHLQLDSGLYTPITTAYPNAKKSMNGMYNCQPSQGFWFVKDSLILNLTSQEYRIQKLTTDTLIITLSRAVTAYNQKYTFWK